MPQPIRAYSCGYPGCRCVAAATSLGSQQVTTAFPSAPCTQPPSPRPNPAYASTSFGSFMDSPKPVSMFPPGPTLPPLYQSLYPTDLSPRKIQDRMRRRQERESEIREARRGKTKADDTVPAVGSSSSVYVAPLSSAAPAAISTLPTPSKAWLYDYQMQVKLFEERNKAALLSARLTKLEADEKARAVPFPLTIAPISHTPAPMANKQTRFVNPYSGPGPAPTPISAASLGPKPQPSEKQPGTQPLQDYHLQPIRTEQLNRQRDLEATKRVREDTTKPPDSIQAPSVPTSAPMPQPSEQTPREWTWDYQAELKRFEQQDKQNRQKKILAVQRANLQAVTSDILLARQFNGQSTRQSTHQNPHQTNTPSPLRAKQDAICAAIRVANRPEPTRVQAVPTPEPIAPPSAGRASTPIPPLSPSQKHRRPSNARNEYSPAALRFPLPPSGPSGPAGQITGTPPAPAPTQTSVSSTSDAQTKQQSAWAQKRHAEVMQHYSEMQQFLRPPQASSPWLSAPAPAAGPSHAAADADALPRVPRFSLAGSTTDSGEDADIDEEAQRHRALVHRSFAGDIVDAEENQGLGDGWTRVLPEFDFIDREISEGEEEYVTESEEDEEIEEDGWWIV